MPIQTWDTAGNVLFNSDNVTNGVCLGVYFIPGGSSFSKSFTLMAGATIRVMALNGSADLTGVTISYPGSVPTVTATAYGAPRYFVIWGTGSPSIMSGAGMQAVSNNGTIALSPSARGCNYIGKFYYVSTVASSGSPGFEGTLGYVQMRIDNCATPPVPVLAADNQKYSRIYNGPYSLGGNSWGIDVQSFDTPPTSGGTSWPPLLAPEILAFVAPANPGAGAQCAVYDTDGTLAYDLLANRLLVTAGPLTFPGGNSGSDTYNQPLPAGVSWTRCGVFGEPRYAEVKSLRVNSTTYKQNNYGGFWFLSSATGNLTRFKYIVFVQRDIDPANSLNDSTAQVEIVDIAGL